MLVGHLAIGLAGKRIEPRISLGTWTLASLLADFVLFVFLIAGLEHIGIAPGVTANRFLGDVPYSHRLLMDTIWGWAQHLGWDSGTRCPQRLYVSATKAETWVGTWAFWAGVALLTLAWYGNVTGGIDPNPVRAGTSGLIFFSLAVAWAYLDEPRTNYFRTSSMNPNARASWLWPSQNTACFRTSGLRLLRAIWINIGTPSPFGI